MQQKKRDVCVTVLLRVVVVERVSGAGGGIFTCGEGIAFFPGVVGPPSKCIDRESRGHLVAIGERCFDDGFPLLSFDC